jgi:tetratricopeptide (TPR) repeat protein
VICPLLSRFSFSSSFIWGVTLCAALLWASPSWSQNKTAQNAPPRIVQPSEEVQSITFRQGQLPEVTLTSSLLYRILAADIAAQRGSFLPAANTTIKLARETSDPRLAKRALELYVAAGNLPGALESATFWAFLDPRDPEASATKLALSASAGKTEGLVQELVKQVDSTPDKATGLARVLGVLNRVNDRAEALKILEEVLAETKQQNTLIGYMALADVAESGQDFKRAYSEAQKAQALAPRSQDAAMRVLDYGLRVNADQAIAATRLFVKYNPNARQLRMMLTGRLTEQGDFDGAQAELADMAKTSPEDFELLYLQAQVAYRAKRLDQSQRFLEQFVAIQTQRGSANEAGATNADSALADAYTMLSRIAEDQQRYDEAVTYLGKIEEPTARYPARLRQAAIRASQGRVDEALRMIDAANPIDDDERLVGLLTVTQILREANRNDAAILRLIEGDKQIENSIEIKYELAMLLERQGKVDQMETYLREVIALDENYAQAYNALGYALADRDKRLPEALTLIMRAHELLPQDPFILDSLGWVKFRMGNLTEAVKYLQQAYDMRPDAEIAAHLGEVFWVQGKKDDARALWLKAVSRDSNNAALNNTMKRFGVKP